MKNDDGGISTPSWNKLECDMHIETYPASKERGSNYGDDSYEVLRSNNVEWKTASDADFDDMVIVGNFGNGNAFNENQVKLRFPYVCRAESRHVRDPPHGAPCSISSFAIKALFLFLPPVVTKTNFIS